MQLKREKHLTLDGLRWPFLGKNHVPLDLVDLLGWQLMGFSWIMDSEVVVT